MRSDLIQARNKFNPGFWATLWHRSRLSRTNASGSRRRQSNHEREPPLFDQGTEPQLSRCQCRFRTVALTRTSRSPCTGRRLALETGMHLDPGTPR